MTADELADLLETMAHTVRTGQADGAFACVQGVTALAYGADDPPEPGEVH